MGATSGGSVRFPGKNAALNDHHLPCFWRADRDAILTRSARRLRVSRSTLSAPLRRLEDALGEVRLLREGRALVLTEAGRVALDQPHTIFAAVDELVRALRERLGVRPVLVAEVDDMATMRLLARDAGTVALLPSVVVRDDLQAGTLAEYGEVPGLRESFYAITVERRYPHPLVGALLARGEAELLAMGEPDGGGVR